MGVNLKSDLKIFYIYFTTYITYTTYITPYGNQNVKISFSTSNSSGTSSHNIPKNSPEF